MSRPDPIVSILAPDGRDAKVASAILDEIGIASASVANLDSLVIDLDRAACAVVTEEALQRWDRRAT